MVVHSTDIDDAGEMNLGVHVFEATLRQLRAGWHHLQAAGVKHAVFTADHGFLLQDETTGVQEFGRKIDPERRYVLETGPRGDEPGTVAVPLSTLQYDGIEGYLLLREDTAVFATSVSGASFVHGGNSPQERFIPVLTVTRKRAALPSLGEYAVEVQPLQPAFGFHRLQLRLVFPPETQTSLGFAQAKEIDLEVRVPGRRDVRALIKEVSGRARLKDGRIQVPVSETWSEVFFALEGETDDRVAVEIWHPDQKEHVRSGATTTLFAVTPPRAPAPTPAAGGSPEVSDAWAQTIDDANVRRVFVHIHRHGVITETEIITILGNPRAARRFALDFDSLVGRLPFRVRSEVNASGKRYVRD